MGGELTKRAKVNELQAAIMRLPQFDGFRTTHRFADGMYSRSVWRPAGVTVVGALHRHEHFTVILSGEILVYTEDGGAKVCRAGDVFVTPAGTKRATHALSDAELMTVHRLPDPEERDLDKIEAALIDDEGSARLFDADNRLERKLCHSSQRP